jgi:hypothetical protein
LQHFETSIESLRRVRDAGTDIDGGHPTSALVKIK